LATTANDDCLHVSCPLSRSSTYRTLQKAGVTNGRRRWRTDPASILQGFTRCPLVCGGGIYLEVMRSRQDPLSVPLLQGLPDILVAELQQRKPHPTVRFVCVCPTCTSVTAQHPLLFGELLVWTTLERTALHVHMQCY